jgi:tetratricopeptide (TPR) repeat protein
LLEELNNIYKPTPDYANIIIEYYDRIEDAKTLYELGLFCIKCNNVFSAELILNKSLKLAENKGNSELAGVVTSKLDEIKSNKSESIDIKIMQTDKDLVFQKIPGSDEISNTEKPKNNVAMDSENYDIEISINDIEVLDEESIYGKALELMRNKSYHEAIVELKKIINTNKKFDVLLNMGMCFEAIENFNEALKRYNEALTKTPNIAYKKKILLKLADLYFDLDNRAKTYSTLKKLFDLDPEFIIPSDK